MRYLRTVFITFWALEVILPFGLASASPSNLASTDEDRFFVGFVFAELSLKSGR